MERKENTNKKPLTAGLEGEDNASEKILSLV
jgi:hypothetical protein